MFLLLFVFNKLFIQRGGNSFKKGKKVPLFIQCFLSQPAQLYLLFYLKEHVLFSFRACVSVLIMHQFCIFLVSTYVCLRTWSSLRIMPVLLTGAYIQCLAHNRSSGQCTHVPGGSVGSLTHWLCLGRSWSPAGERCSRFPDPMKQEMMVLIALHVGW